MILQANYFLRLKPNIITSCCGSLFSTETGGLASEMTALPSYPMKVVFYLSMALTLFSGAYYYFREKGVYLFACASGLNFFISLASIISFISVYFYELPTHHCPFCLLQKEYGYIGYALYAALLGGTISGVGVGMLMPFRGTKSLAGIVPSIQRRLALVAIVLFLIFTVIVTYRMVFTDFVLDV